MIRIAALSAVLLLAFAAGPRALGAAGEGAPTRESVLALAFPEADRVIRHDLVVTAGEAERIRGLSGVGAQPGLLTVHEGSAGGRRLGWAFLDTHRVRTSPETILVVLDPDGRVAATRVVAFHEPPQYRPPERWLEQFPGRTLAADLAVGRGIAGIAGSTLTSRAVTAAVRHALAVYRVKLDAPAPGRDAS